MKKLSFNSLLSNLQLSDLRLILMDSSGQFFEFLPSVNPHYIASMECADYGKIINRPSQARNILNSLMIEVMSRKKTNEYRPELLVIINDINGFFRKGGRPFERDFIDLINPAHSVGIHMVLVNGNLNDKQLHVVNVEISELKEFLQTIAGQESEVSPYYLPFCEIHSVRKKSSIIQHNDDFLQHIEEEILCEYDTNMEDYKYSRSLLELRKYMLDQMALQHQEELLPDIIAFNDALRDALQEMYTHAHSLYEQVSAIQPDIELEAKCFLSQDYPQLHPYQVDNRQDLWNALCDTGWNPMYGNGVTIGPLRLPRDINDTFDALLGMNCPPPNWNEELDLELTKDLHLTSAFHHLFCHTNFALTDFIYIRDFNLEYNLNFKEAMSNEKLLAHLEAKLVAAEHMKEFLQMINESNAQCEEELNAQVREAFNLTSEQATYLLQMPMNTIVHLIPRVIKKRIKAIRNKADM